MTLISSAAGAPQRVRIKHHSNVLKQEGPTSESFKMLCLCGFMRMQDITQVGVIRVDVDRSWVTQE